MLTKFAIAYFVPDVPGELVTHLARQEYIVNVLINGMEEEDEENVVAAENADALAAGIENADFDWYDSRSLVRAVQCENSPSFAGDFTGVA